MNRSYDEPGGPQGLSVRRPAARAAQDAGRPPVDAALLRRDAGHPGLAAPAGGHQPRAGDQHAEDPPERRSPTEGCTDGRRRRHDHRAQAVQAAPPAAHGLTDRAKAERKLAWLLCAPAVVVMLLVAGFPILYAFWLSLRRADLRFPHAGEFVGLSNYVAVLTSSTWWRTSATRCSSPSSRSSLELVLGMLIAQAMYRAIFARTAIRASVLVPYGAVTVVAAFAWRLAFDPATGFAVALAQPDHAAADHPLRLVLRDHHGGGLEDDALHRPAAARRPGACAGRPLQGGEGRRGDLAGSASPKITLPLIKPALMVAVLFRTLDAFRIYDAVLHHDPRRQQHRDGVDPGLRAAGQPPEPRPRLGVAILIFFCVIMIAFIFLPLPRREPGSGGKDDGPQNTPTRKILWVVARHRRPDLRADPGRLDRVAVVQDPDDDRRRQSSCRRTWTLGQLQRPSSSTGFFNDALRNSIGIALITTRDRARVRLDGGLRDHPPGLPGQDR